MNTLNYLGSQAMNNEWIVQNWLWWNVFGPVIKILLVAVILCIGYVVASFISIVINRIKGTRGGDENTKKNKTR